MVGRRGDITLRIRAEDLSSAGFESVKRQISDMADKFDDATDEMVDDAKDKAGKIGGAFSKILSGAAGGGAFGPFGALLGAAKGAASAILGIFSGLGSLVGQALSVGFSVLKGVFDGVVAIAKGAADLIIGAFKTVGSLIGKVFEGVTGIVGKVFNKITAIVAGGTAFIGFKLAELGASYEDLERRGSSLAKSVGQDYGAIQKAIQKGTQGALSDLEAMKQANNALILSVASTPEEFETLASTALGLSQAVGIDVRLAFESLVTGIGRQSKLMLDNVGIIVKAEEAYEKYAKQVGKTANELSDAEKKEAFRLEALEQGRIALERAGGSAATASTKLQQLKAAFSNAGTELGRILLPAAEKLLGLIQPIIDRTLAWADANREIISDKVLVGFDLIQRGVEAIRERLGGLLISAKDKVPGALQFLGNIGSQAMDFLAKAVAIARREFDVLRTAVLNLEFPKDSALVTGFQFAFAAIKEGAFRLLADLTQVFGAPITKISDAFAKNFTEPVLLGINLVLRQLTTLLTQLAVAQNAIPASNLAKRLGLAPDIGKAAVGVGIAAFESGEAFKESVRRRQIPVEDRQGDVSLEFEGRADAAAAEREALAEILRKIAEDATQKDGGAAREAIGEGLEAAAESAREAVSFLRRQVEISEENVAAQKAATEQQKATADTVVKATEEQNKLNEEVVRVQQSLAQQQENARRERQRLAERVRAIQSQFPGNAVLVDEDDLSFVFGGR